MENKKKTQDQIHINIVKLILEKEQKQYNGGKTSLFNKNDLGRLYTLHKNQLKKDQKTKYKAQNYKTPER